MDDSHRGTADAHLPTLWSHLGGDPALLDRVAITGPEVVLPSVFDVTGFAAAAVAAANLAAAELGAVRAGGRVPDVSVGRREAAAAFSCERLLRPQGWELPPIWDPVAGDYRAADGWIRLHTNYRHHLDAVLSVLGVAAERDAVTAAVATWKADELEQAVVDAGGCAAAMHTIEAWRRLPAGEASALQVPVRLGEGTPITGGAGSLPVGPDGGGGSVHGAEVQPLAGIRVLDLTRVIAGPVATRFLAAHGADVLRIDPPAFAEVPALLSETTWGKRCAALDLTTAGDRATFERLVAEAHVVVAGYRPGALAGLGYDPAGLRAINPAVITVTHDAYGWSGPWAGRRGFDSLVQMSTGIAAAGAAAVGSDRPFPLPCQALDHGTGFLLAAGACRALARLAADGLGGDVRGSLVGAANAVVAHPTPEAITAVAPTWTDADTIDTRTPWGPARQAPIPGWIAGHPVCFDPARTAGDLGRHPAAFATA